MTPAEIIKYLKTIDGVYETYQIISTFQFHRKTQNGESQTVTVEILDAGPNSDKNYRYHCFARANDGRIAAGNPDFSVQSALSCMHWEHLDWEYLDRDAAV